MPAPLLIRLQEIDEALAALPQGETEASLQIIEERRRLLAGVPKESLGLEDIVPLRALLERTGKLLSQWRDVRRELAAEIGDAANHRSFLDALERTAIRPAASGYQFRG